MGLKKEQPSFARREGVHYSPRFYLLSALLVFPGSRLDRPITLGLGWI